MATPWTPATGLKQYGLIVARKMGFIALGWVLVYFISQPFRHEGQLVNILMLFSPLVGAAAGLVAGWYMATDSAEDAGFTGLPLWVILVVASILPMFGVEGVMHLIFRSWVFGFGGWMVLSAAILMALASAVWNASSQG
jgi:hypothetical protein